MEEEQSSNEEWNEVDTTTPEKEKVLNKHLLLVMDENPNAFRDEIFRKLEQSLIERSIKQND